MGSNNWSRVRLLMAAFAAVMAGGLPAVRADEKATLKSESFDRDPGWEGFNNRMPPKAVKTRQDFGYSATHFAGQEPGEMGGRIQRSTLPAYYADPIAVKTLNDRLSASGTFAVTENDSSALFFGWFNSVQPGGGRPMGSLGMNIGFKKPGGHLSVRLITSGNRSCGTFITPVIKPKPRGVDAAKRLTLRNDGTRYTWKLDYDPEGAGGNGRFEFTLRGNSATPHDFDGKVFSVDVPAGYKQQGATFDRFGMMNMMKSGGGVNIYFDDLSYDGKTESFSQEPAWIGSGNRGTFQELDQAGVQNFGFSQETGVAGGMSGEAGGTFWRGEKAWGYYADRVGPLTLEDRLVARGKVRLIVGAPDSAMHVGWFNSAEKDASPIHGANFLGVSVGGPTRVGHYFAPAYTTAQGTRGRAEAGPVITPGKVYEWSLAYDPAAGGGKGALQVTLGGESVTLPLKGQRKQEGARFDRFGLFTAGPGGQMVKVFLDDLEYTAAGPSR